MFANSGTFEDTYRIPVYLLRTFGIDVLNTPRWRTFFRWFRFYPFLIVASGCYYSILTIYNLSVQSDRDVKVFTKRIANFFYVFGNVLILFNLLRYTKRIQSLLEKFAEIYPSSESFAGWKDGDRSLRSYFWPKWLVVLVLIFIVNYIGITMQPPITSILIYLYRIIVGGTGEEAKFPYLRISTTRFTVNDERPLAYVLITLLEIMLTYSGFSLICTDIWAVYFIMHLCMHYEELNTRILNHSPLRTPTLSPRDKDFIRGFIQKHQLILHLSDEVKSTFASSYLLIVGYVTCIATGASMYILSIAQLNADLLNYLLFLTTVCAYFFVVCYFSQMLYTKSLSLTECVYNHGWYNAPVSYRKVMLIVMLRAQKPSVLNAGGFIALTYEAFTMVMATAYRATTVFKSTID